MDVDSYDIVLVESTVNAHSTALRCTVPIITDKKCYHLIRDGCARHFVMQQVSSLLDFFDDLFDTSAGPEQTPDTGAAVKKEPVIKRELLEELPLVAVAPHPVLENTGGPLVEAVASQQTAADAVPKSRSEPVVGDLDAIPEDALLGGAVCATFQSPNAGGNAATEIDTAALAKGAGVAHPLATPGVATGTGDATPNLQRPPDAENTNFLGAAASVAVDGEVFPLMHATTPSSPHASACPHSPSLLTMGEGGADAGPPYTSAGTVEPAAAHTEVPAAAEPSAGVNGVDEQLNGAGKTATQNLTAAEPSAAGTLEPGAANVVSLAGVQGVDEPLNGNHPSLTSEASQAKRSEPVWIAIHIRHAKIYT